MKRNSDLWRVVWLIFVVTASANYIVPIFPLYQQQFDLKTGTLTALFSAYLLSLIPLLISARWLLERFKVFYLAGASLGLVLLSAILGLVSPNLVLLFFIRILQGAGVGLFMGVLNALLVENILVSEQAKATKLTGLITLLGFGVGPLLCAVMAQTFLANAIHAVYFVLLSLAVSGIGIWLSLKNKQHTNQAQSDFVATMAVKIQPVFWQVIAPAIFIMYALNGCILAFLPSYTRTLLNSKNLMLSGFLMFILLSGGLVLQKLAGIASPFKKLQIGLIFLLVGTMCVILGGKYGQLAWLLIGVICHAIATTWIYPSTVTLSSNLVEAKDRTSILIRLYVIGYVGLGLPTLIIGQIANHLGMVKALSIGWGVAFMATLCVLYRARKLKICHK